MNQYPLLIQLYTNSHLGYLGTKALYSHMNKTHKLAPIIKNEFIKYKEFFYKSEKLLKEFNIEAEEPKEFYKMISDINIALEKMTDFNDSILVDLMIRGLTMALQDISVHINKYGDKIHPKSLRLASKYQKYLEVEIIKCQEYLEVEIIKCQEYINSN